MAYAIWEIVGLSLITIIAIFAFGAELKMQEYIGLALALLWNCTSKFWREA